MSQWWADIVKILKGSAIVLSVIFTVFVINQFISLYQFLSNLHPILAMIVVTILAAGILYFAYRIGRQWLASSEIIEFNPEATEEEYQDYLESLLEVLKKNPHLVAMDLDNEDLPMAERVNQAVDQLDALTLPMIKENASAIFLTTAISQNGSLDSLVVLFSLFRMIWQLANVYQTRPTLRGFLKLYGQVAGVVLMARTIEDADLIQSQMEPLIASVIGESVASAIPGMVPISNLVVSSLMEGSVNAFLTLRVGVITQAYLGMERRESKQFIRRSAAIQSLSHMGSIIKENGKVVMKTMGNAVKNTSVGTAKKWFNFDGVFK